MNTFDPKHILRNIKETNMEKRKAGEDRMGNMSGVKDISQSGSKHRTIKEGKSKGRFIMNKHSMSLLSL